MTREEGKTLPEAKGEVRRAINIFRYFAGEGSRLPGHAGALRARPRPHVRHPQAHRRGRPRHAVEFPQRHPRVEARARADLRQHRGAEAGVGRAAQRLAHRGSAARGRHSARRGQFRRRARAASWARRWSAPSRSRRSRSPARARSATGCTARPPSAACASSSKWAARIPTIVLADADFNSAVENVVNAAFFSTGQKCTATSRAIVEDADLRQVSRAR